MNIHISEKHAQNTVTVLVFNSAPYQSQLTPWGIYRKSLSQ